MGIFHSHLYYVKLKEQSESDWVYNNISPDVHYYFETCSKEKQTHTCFGCLHARTSILENRWTFKKIDGQDESEECLVPDIFQSIRMFIMENVSKVCDYALHQLYLQMWCNHKSIASLMSKTIIEMTYDNGKNERREYKKQ